MTKLHNIINNIEAIVNKSKYHAPELLYERIILELNNYKFDFLISDLKVGAKLNRIRINEKPSSPFEEFKDIIYPPADKVGKFNRTNRPGQSMFYCAENEPIAQFELLHDYITKYKENHKHFFTYSEWQTIKPLKILIMAIAEENKEINNGINLQPTYKQYLKDINQEKKDLINLQYSFTYHYFTKLSDKNKTIYMVTSAISNFLSLIYDFDGIIYPSAETGCGYNVAFKPYVVDDEMIKPKDKIIMREWLVKSPKDVYDTNKQYSGIIDGKKLIWDIPYNI